MSLPLLVSVPHAGLTVPDEVRELCALTPREIAEDGDLGAREIYAIEGEVAAFVTTDVARAIVDMNRAEDDRRKDGVVKTHTCWDVPVYDPPPSPATLQGLIDAHWRPYHARIRELARRPELVLGVDLHTMAAEGPPVGPDPGRPRPAVCLSNADGTCPEEWLQDLGRCFEESFGRPVSLNEPFLGGYIIRTHAAEGSLPWVQVELSRAPWVDETGKRERVLAALGAFCAALGRA